MTKIIQRYRIKNKSLDEVKSVLFNLKTFPQSFSDSFEVKAIKIPKQLTAGAKVIMTLKKFGVFAPSEYKVLEVSSKNVTYRQIEGLMKKWEHSMTLSEYEGGVELIDCIEYEVPFGLLGHLTNDLYFKSEVKTMLYNRLKLLKLK